MSFHLPQHSTSTTSTNTLNYLTNKYLLLNINNINLPNYKICIQTV